MRQPPAVYMLAPCVLISGEQLAAKEAHTGLDEQEEIKGPHNAAQNGTFAQPCWGKLTGSWKRENRDDLPRRVRSKRSWLRI